MNDRNRLPPPESADARDAVVTYSRIGSRIVSEAEEPVPDERIAPIFDAVEVPPIRTRARDAGDLGGQTMADRPAAHAGGGRSLRFVLLSGVAAIAVGIAVLGLAYNNARTAPTLAKAGSTEPAKVASVSNESPVDLTPASGTTAEGEAEGGLQPSPSTATPEPAKLDVVPASASQPEPVPVAIPSDDSGEAKQPVAAPPIPRSRPKPVASGSAKPPAERTAQMPAADDGDFVEDVEKTLANAPRPLRSEDSGDAVAADEPQPLPAPQVATVYPADEAPAAEEPPQRLVPPADIPNVGSDDQAYEDSGDGDYYDAPATGDGYGQPAEPAYGDGGWDSRPEVARTAPQWVVLGVRRGRAIVDGREYGVFMVRPGSEIPGVGTVEAIERRGNGWVVVTSSGAVLTSLADAGGQY